MSDTENKNVRVLRVNELMWKFAELTVRSAESSIEIV